MKKILVVESSPLGEKSVSRRLTQDILKALREEHPESQVTVRDLAREPLPHLGAEQVAAFYTPAEKRDERLKEAVRASDAAVDELLAADVVVIGAPMWNFGVPSALKAWIDHIARAGRTFAYGAGGPQGLVKGKKVYIAAASGGIYSEGPAAGMDFQVPYLKAVLGFIGLKDVSVIRAEGMGASDRKEAAYDKALRAIGEALGRVANLAASV